MPTQEQLSPEDHQNREVHARYGLAMYYAQALEAGMKGALVVAELSESSISTQDDFDNTWTTNFTAAMGKLLRRFQPYLAGDDELREDLQLALRVRNQLAHHFFWDHTTDILTTDGRQRMIDECAAAAEFLRELDGRVYAVSLRYADAMGIVPEPFDEGLAESRAEKIADGPPDARICGRCGTRIVSAGTDRRTYRECPNCRAVALT